MIPQLVPEQSLYSEWVLSIQEHLSTKCMGYSKEWITKKIKKHNTAKRVELNRRSLYRRKLERIRTSVFSATVGNLEVSQLKIIISPFCTCPWMTTSEPESWLGGYTYISMSHWSHKYELVNNKDSLHFPFLQSEAQRSFVMPVVSGNLKLGLYISSDPCSFPRKDRHRVCLCPSYTMKQEW